MTTPEPPDPTIPRKRQRRWFRFLPARAALALAGVALLVVGGVAGALMFGGSGDSSSSRPALTGAEQRGPGPGGPGRGPERGPGGPRRDGPAGPPAPVADGPVLLGTVVSTGDGTLVVTQDGAAQRTLRTDDRTRVDGAGVRSLSELKPGQRVAVTVTGTGDAATAVAVRVPEVRVLGTVTAITGDTATVTSEAGLVVTVNTAAASPKPAVGDTVSVTGTASGTTITATTVTVLPKAA